MPRLPLLLAWRRRRGGPVVEYAILASLVGAVALGAVVLLGDRTRGVLERTDDVLVGDAPAPGAPGAAPLEGILPGHLVWSGDGRFSLSPAVPSEIRGFSITNVGFGRSAPFAAPAIRGVGFGAFEIVSTDCPGTLGAGEDCQVLVRASVVGNGAWAAEIAADGAPGGVPLRAEAAGFAPAFAWTGDALFALDGAAQTPAAEQRTFTLANVGTLAGAPAPVALSGTGFSLVSTTCGAVLEIGDACEAVVRAEAADNGALSGQLASGDALLPLLGTASGFAAQLAWEGAPVFGIASPPATPALLERTLSLRNDGTLAATGLAVGLSGDTAGPVAFSLVSTTCGATLAAGGRCDAVVRLTALANGPAAALLSSGGPAPAETSLVGDAAGVAPALAWSGPAGLSLDGTPPAALPVGAQAAWTLANAGNQDAAGLGPVSVAGAGWSLVSTTCGPALAQGAACDAILRLEASANGSFPGTLSIGGGPGLALSGAASGFAPALAWSGTSSFAIDGTPGAGPLPRTASQTFTLTNAGTAPATGLSVGVSGAGFAAGLPATTCTTTLAVGASCAFTVQASASADGTFAGTLSSGGATPAVQPLSATAMGFAPAWAWSGGGAFTLTAPTGNPSTVDRVFTLTNVGTLAGTPATPTVSGSGAGFAYSLVSHTCGAAVAVGATCQAVVRATYADNVASAAGTLSGGGAAQALSGSASGFAAALAWTALPADFALDVSNGGVSSPTNASAGPTGTATLTNVGTLSTGAITVALSGSGASAYEIVAGQNGCAGQTLAPGASCTVGVRLVAGLLPADYPLQLTASASPSVVSPVRQQRVRGPRLVTIADNGANMNHASWTSQGPVREWRVRNDGNQPTHAMIFQASTGGMNWAVYDQNSALAIGSWINPNATITLQPGQFAILHLALQSGQQRSATATSTTAGNIFLGARLISAYSATYTAAPAMAWVGGGGHAMDANAGGNPPGTNIWSAWHRMTVRNTGNVAIWTGSGIEADNWDRVASWGTHTCANRWLNPGEDCVRDVAFLYTNNEWVGRNFILWGSSAHPGWLGLWGQGFNFVAAQRTWRVQGVMDFWPGCFPGTQQGTISGGECPGNEPVPTPSLAIGTNTGVACGSAGATCASRTAGCNHSVTFLISYICQ